MAKQLNISLGFTADTSKAKREIQDLVETLNKLSSNTQTHNNLPITKEIIEAQNAAKQLSNALQSAFNSDTGKLDLTSFNKSLHNSGMSLKDYSLKLTALGVEGDQAFLKIAQSIVNTQAPLRKSNALLQEFVTTLKNTARWQLSSSILHGFAGAVQQAYGYAKDLDKSLNDIRIVSGRSADEMVKFAESANKAAQALHSTTTAYTNASLIYYQQGLSEEEIQKRTEITIKMANVARQDAQTVSDQMTAVWNNFYDGTKSLEYYADVMTALGAKTASSTDEIAGGLEKFAAIGDTIGLSYEYAASALATITSNTRQSEEVVGTALKTIFARIQGLNLGETLDDGTTLNKYSEALDKVGISIFNQAGGLKTMDELLDELGSKWDGLNSAQQTALAQTVAGVRQYTQLIALMENWNNGDNDSFQANLLTAQTSTGALQEQANIYAEGWEASRNRVKAALESIYDSLIDEEFFIELNDALTVGLNGVDSFIDSIGGAKGVVLLFGTVLTKIFKTDIASGINNAIQNFRIFAKITDEETANIKKQARDMAVSITKDMDSLEMSAMRESLERTYQAQTTLANQAKSLSPEQIATAEEALQVAQSYNEQAIAAGKAADAANKLRDSQYAANYTAFGGGAEKQTENLMNVAFQSNNNDLLSISREIIAIADNVGVSTDQANQALREYAALLRNGTTGEELNQASNNLFQSLKNLQEPIKDSTNNFNAFQSEVDESARAVVEAATNFETLKQSLVDENINGSSSELVEQIEKIVSQANNAKLNVADLIEAISRFKKETTGAAVGSKEWNKALTNLTSTITSKTISTNDMNAAIVKTATGTENLSAKFLSEANSARIAANDNITFENAVKAADQASAKCSLTLAKNTLAYQSLGSALTGTLGSLTSFAMAISSIQSIFDTIKNEELSGFEKTTQVIMSLGMAIPMLVSGFGNLGKAIQFVTSNQEKGLAVQLAHLLNTKAEVAQGGYLILSKNGEEIARRRTAKAAKDYADKVEGATVATVYDTKATLANVNAKMLQYWWIGAIALIAVGAVIAIKEIAEAYNAETEAAQKAAEAAATLKETYENARQAADEFKSTISNYDDAINSLQKLTKGTVEYQEALLKANDAAYDLINKYDDLTYTVNADGLITINQESLQKAQQEQLKSLEILQAQTQQAQAYAKQASVRADTTEFLRKNIKTKENALLEEDNGYGAAIGATAGGAALGIGTAIISGVKLGGAIGSIAGPIGTVIGTVAGAAFGAIVGNSISSFIENSATDRERNAIDKLSAAYRIEGEGIFETERFKKILGEGNEDLVIALRANEEETRNLVRETAAANQLARDANQREFQLLYGKYFQDLNKDQQQVATIVGSSKREELINKASDEIFNSKRSQYGFGFEPATIKAIYKNILKSEGTVLSKDELKKISLETQTERVSQAFVDALIQNSGEAPDEFYGWSQLELYMRQDLPGAIQALAKETENFINSIKVQSQQSIDKNLLAYETSNDIGAMSTNFNVKDISVDNELIKEFAASAGMSVEDYIASVSNAFTNALNNQKTFASQQLTTTAEGIFNDLIKNTEIPVNQLDEVSTQIRDAFLMGGEEEALKIANLYNQLGDQADEFNKAISTIDWKSADLGSFKNHLADSGIELNGINDDLLKVILALEKWDIQLQKTTGIIYETMADIAKKQYGDIIDKETYDELPEHMKSFYRIAAGDNKYRLIDDESNYLYASSNASNAYRVDYTIPDENQINALNTFVTSMEGPFDNRVDISRIIKSKLESNDLSYKDLTDFLLGIGKDFVDAEDLKFVKGVSKELEEGTFKAGSADAKSLVGLFTNVWKTNEIDNDKIKEIVEKYNTQLNDSIETNLAEKYDLAWEEVSRYETIEQGVAQLRFKRGFGKLSGLYDDFIQDDGSYQFSDANRLSNFADIQSVLADVLNVENSAITEDFFNQIQKSGQFTQLTNVKTDEEFANVVQDLRKIIFDQAFLGVEELANQASLFYGVQDKFGAQKLVDGLLTNIDESLIPELAKVLEKIGWDVDISADNSAIAVNSINTTASLYDDLLRNSNKKTSSADKIDNVRLSETVERYKEITDSLNDLEDAYSDASKQADRLYGADRLEKLKEQNELLKQEQILLERKKKEAEAWLVIDKQALSTAFQDAGFELRIDEDTGNILNYTEVLIELNKKLNEQIDIRNKITDKDEAETFEKNNIEPIKKQIEAIRELAGAYDETQQVIVDSQNKIDDTFNEWQDNIYQQLTYKLDIKLEIEDFEMREIEYQINKLGDDIESRVELASLLFKNGENSKFDSYSDSLQHYMDLYDWIEENKNNISPEKYIEGLKQSYNGIYDNLEALQSLDEEMQHYYADTLAMGAEELGKHTAKLEHFTTVLDYYHSLITLINGEYDYDGIDKVLTGKAQTLKNELDVASSNYQMLLQQQADIQKLVDTAETEERKEFYQRELEAVSAMVDEQHEIVLAKTQEWAEAQKAIMENIVAEAAHDMEKAFTNGMGFDALNNSIERVSSNSDEYLTKTNQIYETQKLMNTAQQTIDKTTNNAAKVRLKNYQDEIKVLQDKNKLTNYEIELAKARYDVLLAQIALEEAQNAKSTVRMQRDNEGNYGYVYTADQTKVAEAEMNLMDTQNELYNIRLEAANDYGQKIMDLNQQLADDLIALEKARNEGQYANEAEYQAAKDQILREYYDLYTTYSDIYTMATTEDARIQQEAWVTAYDDIINSADNWQQNVVLFTSQCETAYSNYRATVEAESEIINELLNSIGSSVDEVKTKSDELKTYLNDTFIPELGDTYKAVSDLTTEYLNQKDTLTDLITKSGEYVRSIGEALKAYQNFEEETNPPGGSGGENTLPPLEEIQPEIEKAIADALAEAEKKIEVPNTSDDEPISEIVEEVTNATEKLKRIAIEREILSSLPYYARFNTGGYTGEWGPQGRLAVLDEKELVLNKNDTENFMIAMDVLRSIVDTIDINALHSQIPYLSSAGILTAGSGQLEQSVSIEAHFPNVSNSNEIEEAFNNLINTASQYANRKI